jgi:putative sterol carrier protein
MWVHAAGRTILWLSKEDRMTKATTTTPTATTAFFDALSRQPSQPLLERATGTLRFDLERPDGDERWLVRLDRGRAHVERADAEANADAVVRGPGELFDRIAMGQANATAAVLRGALTVEGALDLVVLFQRLFPSPAEGREEP